MPTAHVNGIDIEYVTDGDPAAPSLLLVMGLGAQLITWPQGFVDGLRDRGFFVIRYDNRDCGLSTKFEGRRTSSRCSRATRRRAPYRVEDMADDAAALLTELGVAKAHVVGASMGGMITQALVINHADRFLSACSIMSTTGDRSVGAPTGEAMTALLRPVATNREEAIEASLEGSSGDRVARLPDRTRASCGSGPQPPTTAPIAPRAWRASSPPSSPRPTAPRGCTACAFPSS